MKFKSLILLMLFSFRLEANVDKCFSKEDASKYFFINGIWNFKKENAVSSLLTLQKKIVKSQNQISLLYNESEGILADLEETFGFIDFNSKRSVNQNAIFSEKQYTLKSKNFYKALSKDKINVVIAHSEGNLFAEKMCFINDENKIIENIAIAPPLEKLSCNTFGTYVLFDTDLVINKIDLAKPDFKELKPTNTKGFGDISHSLEAYLNDNSVVSLLNQDLNRTIKFTYEKNFSFKLAELSVKPDDVIDQTSNIISSVSEKISLWSREKKAFMNSVSYITSMTSSLNSKNVIKKLLKTEIPAESEQEFADMLAYSLNQVASLCASNLPKEFRPLCASLEIKDYFSQKEDPDYFPYFSALKVESQQIVLQCNNMDDLYSNIPNKTIPAFFIFKNKAPNLIIHKNNTETSYDLETESPIKNKTVKVSIGNFILNKNPDQSLDVNFVYQKPDLNSRNLAQSEDLMSKCNTLEKLASQGCQPFFKHIKDKYFSYYQ